MTLIFNILRGCL